MTKKKPESPPESGSVVLIPLCKLKKSSRNARKTPHTKAEIEALAASIKAHGMIQNPVVEPEFKGRKATGYYLVTAGEGRRLAQLLRAKHGEIKKNEPIRCLVDTTHNAFEISVAENALRANMHPADQFEAFFKLHSEHGLNDDDIAARFGVTAAVVRQRLTLAAVSPKLIQAYRAGAMNLDQLTAFAITDDHAKQEKVWTELPEWRTDRDAILQALTEQQVPADDRRALFVGAEAYQAAGGAIIRDLFAEKDAGYFADAALLESLAQEKLQAIANGITAEGWKWVEVMPEFDHSFTASMRRVYPVRRDLTEAEETQLEELEAEYEAFDENDSEEALAEAERLEQAIAALTGENAYASEDIARAGAVVSLAANGQPRIERGFVRSEDEVRGAKKTHATRNGAAPESDKLVAALTACRTMALRDALAQHSEIALVAVIHALAAATFYPHGTRVSCMHISGHVASLRTHAPGIDETDAAERIAARHDHWAQQMPEDANDLWVFLGNLSQDQGLALLAHCASYTIDSVQVPHAREPLPHNHIAELIQAVHLDMAEHWKPTAANYLGRVSKQRILEAVREGVSKDAADNLASMKKEAMAEAAEHRLEGSRWLPVPLRAPEPSSLAVAAE